ncbi:MULTISPECIES: SMI1/KNR4 family protein [Streptomyces]|uniref:SMI1/KNR4 family protein n=1 Tax=Streptomyces TaxID=1883 RepID=UPI0028D32113|nr:MULTISPECIES: SMI1/KNR4 family protein [unclassified Streptomyces]WSN42598.1 SMI1/KNR4 family protein [Streptomyces sp. NBC_01334]
MIHTDDRQFPAALAAALAVPFDYNDGDGVDFEPFAAFLSAEETTDWFRAWTGNAELSGDGFRVFGQDGSGGFAAFWLIRPSCPLVDQPVVFLGSEGETGVVARDLSAFLWLLAGGFGPCEAATSDEPDWTPSLNSDFMAVAERFAADQQQPAAAVIEQATREFPDFDDTIMELCR